MKIAIAVILVSLLLGCDGENRDLNRAMELRAELLAHSCAFDAEVTADYGDKLHTFTLSCQGDTFGNLGFRVKQPESIEGISGTIASDGGKLNFEDTVLAFPLLADDQVTPISAPWLLLKTLQGGYLTSAGMDGEYLRLTIHDSYEEDALQLDIWLDGENRPVRADILYGGRRILALCVTNFQIL